MQINDKDFDTLKKLMSDFESCIDETLTWCKGDEYGIYTAMLYTFLCAQKKKMEKQMFGE